MFDYMGAGAGAAIKDAVSEATGPGAAPELIS
jgi:hypothetical protein